MTAAKKKTAEPPSTEPEHVPFDWHTYGLMAEFKDSLKQDPFYDLEEAKKEGTIERSDEVSCENRGQLAQYASELLNHQHRTHTFQIFVVQDFVRFIYWDRAGAVVSAKFNYVEEPTTLAEFFWRYNHMSAERRGWDASVSEPSDADVELFRKTVKAFVGAMADVSNRQRRIERAEHTLDEDYPPYKMTVGAVKTGDTQDVIIQKPFEVCRSPAGRATRAYLAYSLTEQRLVFLKDSWRVAVMDLSDEDSIYFKLIEENVPHIPRVLCAGDVVVDGVVQETQTQALAQKSAAEWWVPCSSSRRHQHHRILQDLAYPLWTAANSQEYTEAFRDAFISASYFFSILPTCAHVDGQPWKAQRRREFYIEISASTTSC